MQKMKYFITVLSIFIYILIVVPVKAENQQTINDFSELLVQSLKNEDYTILKSLVLNSDEELGLQDCKCEENLKPKYKELNKTVYKSFFELHQELLMTGLDLQTLKLVEVYSKNWEAYYKLDLHVTLENKHGLIRADVANANGTYKLIDELKLDIKESKLTKTLDLSDFEPINKPDDNELVFSCNHACLLQSKSDFYMMDGEKYTRLKYYYHDSLYAITYFSPQAKVFIANRYYVHGVLRDSSIFMIKTDIALKKLTSPVQTWDEMKDILGPERGYISYDYYINGNPSEFLSFMGDTVIRKYFYYNNKLRKDKRSVNNETYYEVSYNVEGDLEHIYKPEKEKATNLDELRDFAEFENVYKYYNNGYYERPLVVFHRNLSGWYVELIETKEQFLIWSFKEHSFVWLPAQPFNMKKYTTPRHFNFTPPKISLFPGSPEETKECALLLLKEKDRLNKKESEFLSVYLYNLLKDKLGADNLVIDDSLKVLLGDFLQLTKKTGADDLYFILRRILEIRIGVSEADKYLPALTFPVEQENYAKFILKNIEQDGIAFFLNALLLDYYQSKTPYRQDVAAVSLTYLKYGWYREYVAKKFSAKTASIFGLPAKLYQIESFVDAKLVNEKVEIGEYIEKIKKAPSNSIPELNTIYYVKGINNNEPIIELNSNMIPYFSFFGFQGLELVNYIIKNQKKTSFDGNLGYLGMKIEMEDMFLLTKFDLNKPLNNSSDLSPQSVELIKSIVKGTRFPENFEEYIFQRSWFEMSRGKIKEENKKIIAKSLSVMYRSSWNKDNYEDACKIAMLCIEYGYDDNAEMLLDKCFIGRDNFCAALNYYDRDKVGDANDELMRFLKEKNKQSFLRKYSW